MTTQKRYEEMADALVDGLAISELGIYDADVMKVAEALRTAARKAQVRVLEELEGRIDGYEVVFDSLRERLDSGEDL